MMGTGGSKAVTEKKAIDASGAVNNNIVIEDPVHIRSPMIMVLLWIICVIKLIELALFVYREHKKAIKKKYANNPS